MDLVNHTFVNYIGNYDYYLEKKEELTAAYSNTSRLENNSSSAAADLASDSKLSWQEQKEAQAKERKRANEFKKTEERIGVLEDRSAEIDILMSQEEVYTNSVKCQELAKERAEIDAELETLYEKWDWKVLTKRFCDSMHITQLGDIRWVNKLDWDYLSEHLDIVKIQDNLSLYVDRCNWNCITLH